MHDSQLCRAFRARLFFAIVLSSSLAGGGARLKADPPMMTRPAGRAFLILSSFPSSVILNEVKDLFTFRIPKGAKRVVVLQNFIICKTENSETRPNGGRTLAGWGGRPKGEPASVCQNRRFCQFQFTIHDSRFAIRFFAFAQNDTGRGKVAGFANPKQSPTTENSKTRLSACSE